MAIRRRLCNNTHMQNMTTTIPLSNKIIFKRPKRYYDDCDKVIHLILWWSTLDDLIHLLNDRRRIKAWEKQGIPHITKVVGGTFISKAIKIIDHDHKRERNLTYQDIIVNRYQYKECFAQDDYRRIAIVFQCLLNNMPSEGQQRTPVASPTQPS